MNAWRKSLLDIAIVVAILAIAWIFETMRNRGRLWLGIVAGFIVALVLILGLHFAIARDLGQWEATDPSLRDWYQALMQPDNPQTSCCGEADAYWCDDYYGRGGKAFCRITDDRPDAPRGRPHVELGTEIEIPEHKLKWDRSNPTGHGVVFLSRAGYVFCFVAPGGV